MVAMEEHSTRTPAARKKYQDYTSEIRDSRHAVHIEFDRGAIFRFPFAIERMPAERKFVVYVRRDATTQDRRIAALVAERLPHGEWARFPDTWSRRRRNGHWVYRQGRGHAIDDPLLELEHELMIDEFYRQKVGPRC